MRLIIISFLLMFLPLIGKSQMNERGKKNFYLEPEGAITFANHKANAFTGNKFSTAFGMSGGKVFGGLIKTGLVYRYNQHTIGNFDTVEVYTNLQHQSVGLKAELMIPIASSSMGKSKNYECKSLTNFLIIGPEFDFNFGAKANYYTINSTAFLLNASWAMLFKKSGGRKKQAANDLYISINLKKGLGSFAKSISDAQKFYSTYWGVSIIWVRYKTSNWLR